MNEWDLTRGKSRSCLLSRWKSRKQIMKLWVDCNLIQTWQGPELPKAFIIWTHLKARVTSIKTSSLTFSSFVCYRICQIEISSLKRRKFKILICRKKRSMNSAIKIQKSLKFSWNSNHAIVICQSPPTLTSGVSSQPTKKVRNKTMSTNNLNLLSIWRVSKANKKRP